MPNNVRQWFRNCLRMLCTLRRFCVQTRLRMCNILQRFMGPNHLRMLCILRQLCHQTLLRMCNILRQFLSPNRLRMFHLLRWFCLQTHLKINWDHWIMKIEIHWRLNHLQLMHISKCNIKYQKTANKKINETIH